MSWESVRDLSLLESRRQDLGVRIVDVEEWGYLESTIPSWGDRTLLAQEDRTTDATDRFVSAIKSQLEVSKKKHVYIYVHGFKVTFENPVLVSSELWHFLGYDGAFIAYSWPSTPSRFAYIKDSDTSEGYGIHLRRLIEAVAAIEEVEAIHILGYSNGTRLVVRALHQLALIHSETPVAELQDEFRIQNVILVGSDLDLQVFGAYVTDGVLDVPRHTTIYMSQYDKALGLSRLLTTRQRLGQVWNNDRFALDAQGEQAVEKLSEKVSFINVSDTEGSRSKSGHGCFSTSPWASSDVLMTMYFGLPPAQRGLAKRQDMAVFEFPPDYVARLRDAIERVAP